MIFIIGRGCAKLQIPKKWKWPNWVEYCDETLPSAKFWKSENGPISWTDWNILINFCVNIDIDKI